MTGNEIVNSKDESFRDTIATIDDKGKRAWIYAKKPKGKLYNARTLLSIVYLVVFFSLPFIRVHGDPLFLFNVIERKFILFGAIFWPQDFFLFGIGMLVFILFIVLFTVIFGRVFCGWICPQTIFMEMVFRKIEYWIEGDAQKQKALNAAPWNDQKILKKTTKHLVFFLVAFIIANTFLSYIIGTENTFAFWKEPIRQHWGKVASLLIFTGLFYGVYARFREQVCIVVCPYGRLQGVMLDKNSILVAYDYLRGEKRGKINKKEERTLGDCIDCHQCVKVCPTGIDIRNGTQLECVNCTACIDACDSIMKGINKPTGLIRYTSEAGIANKQKLRFTARTIAYTIVLCLLMLVEVFLLSSRSDVDATIVRARGMLYQEQPGDSISNLYSFKLLNKTHDAIPVELKLEMPGSIRMVGKNRMLVSKEGYIQGSFFLVLKRTDVRKRKTSLLIGIYSNGKKIKTVSTNFLGPITN